MKCPKCGYISFDHNQNCPKCKKPLTGQAAKMNLPDYEPAPPFLLASLVGEESGGGIGMDIDHLPGADLEGNGMIVGPGYEQEPADFTDSHEDMEITLDEDVEKSEDSRFELPGLAEAVAEMNSEEVESDDFSSAIESPSLDEEQSEDVDDLKEEPENRLEPANFPSHEQSESSSEMEEEFGFQLFDLSSGQPEEPQEHQEKKGDETIAVLLKEEEQENELEENLIDEETAPLLFEEDLTEQEISPHETQPSEPLPDEQQDGATEPLLYLEEEEETREHMEEAAELEIEFDPDKYSIPAEEQTPPGGAGDRFEEEYEGIPFDPEALEIESDSREEYDSQNTLEIEQNIGPGDIANTKMEVEKSPSKDVTDKGAETPEEEELTITLDDVDFEVLENEDEEKS